MLWRGAGSITGCPYGTPEYSRAWREIHKERLSIDRKKKYKEREGRRKRRSELINTYKVGKGCSECGYNKHPSALDFDHLDPADKKFTISHRLDLSTVKTLFKEIRKCRILCANCHRIHTTKEKHHSISRTP